MDEEAFISAAHELRQSAVSVSRRYGATEVEAQDVAQETMIRLWQMLDTIDGRRRLNSLTTCIARN
ncbi:MAG: sigma factor, partial [Prevotella sp.]